MNRPVAHKTRRYTLVEILVAMAILVIMMGFLFQFVIGAQRIWSASARTASVFDQAQLVLELLENDLQYALVVDEKESPGGSVPLLFKRNTTTENLENMYVFTSTDATAATDVGYFSVYYALDGNGVLSRYVVDKNITVTPYTFKPHFVYGFNPIENVVQATLFVTQALNVIENDNTMKVEIAEGIETLKIEFAAKPEDYLQTSAPPSTILLFRKKPRFIRLTLSMYDQSSVKALVDAGASTTVVDEKKTETTRTFTKILFLQ